MVCTSVTHLSKLKLEDPMPWTIWKKLDTHNVNVYFSLLGMYLSDVERLFDIDCHLYISETIRAKHFKKNHD